MRSGPMRYRLTIQSLTEVLNSLGEAGSSSTWGTVITCWAAKRELRGREYSSEQVETYEQTVVFQIRNPKPTAINTAMRAQWTDGASTTHTYNIRQVVLTGPADKDLELRCTEVL